MWVMAPFGILMPAERPAKYTPKGDERTFQIRARCRHHLDILRALYMQGSLGETIYTPEMDYEYRAYCTPDDWAWAMFEMSKNINYKKFKPETMKFSDHALHAVYNRIWSVVLNALSTPQHRYDYWHPQDHNPGRQGTSTASTGKGSPAWQDMTKPVPLKEHFLPPEPGEPYQLPAGSSDVVESGNGWPADDGLATSWPSGVVHRGGAADRDHYVAEVWDSTGRPDDSTDSLARVLAETDDVLDQHYAQIAEILHNDDSDGDDVQILDRIDHSQCNHGQGSAAKARCRNRHRRALRASA